MKPSNTHSRHQLPTPERVSLVLALALALPLFGCVTNGVHDQVVEERDILTAQKAALTQRIRALETANESLDGERLDMFEELDSLQRTRDDLAGRVGALEVREERLEENLASRASRIEEQGELLAVQAEEVAKLRGTYEGLVEDLEAEISQGQVEIQQLRNGLQVNVSQDILFDSGSARIDGPGRAALLKVAGRLRELQYRIEVLGHSDDRGIRGVLAERYPTNWELAGARAAGVVRLFEEHGVGGERLSAISRAQYAPVESNDTDVGRAANRRIELRLLPIADPGSAQPTADATGG